jgi:hypothetical protein
MVMICKLICEKGLRANRTIEQQITGCVRVSKPMGAIDSFDDALV